MKTIRNRVIVALTILVFGAALGSALIGYLAAKDAIQDEAFDKLTAAREMKAGQVEDYFTQIRHQVLSLSADPAVAEAAVEFRNAFDAQAQDGAQNPDTGAQSLRLYYQKEFLPRLNENLRAPATPTAYWPTDPATQALQRQYLVENAYDVGSKHLLDAAPGDSAYNRTHKIFHPFFRDYLERFGFYDIFLVEPEQGRIIYSVYKEVDFATSLLTGPFRDTNIGEAFRAAQAAPNREFVRLVDFAPYPPSYAAQASFIASPIFQGQKLVGVLIFQMPQERIDDIMTHKKEWSQIGLGQSGETYVVGEDFTLRTQSRFLIEDKEEYLAAIRNSGVPADRVERIQSLNSAIGLQIVKTAGVQAALDGQKGKAIIKDYRGVDVLSSYQPLDIPDVKWVLMSEIDVAEAYEPAVKFRNRFGLLTLAMAALILILAVLFVVATLARLGRLQIAAGMLAAGELETAIQTEGADEVADLARSFDAMRVSIKALVDRQNAAIDALATPIIPLSDQVIAVPLVGDMDSRRVHQFKESLVHALHDRQVPAALVDMTGIHQLEPAVAEGIVKACRAARLLGASVVLTGLQPQVAALFADLDLSLDTIEMERNLQAGLERAEYLIAARTQHLTSGQPDGANLNGHPHEHL
jgi:anti-anti-sigma regulatory factor/HAMP domain-containing protein